jgi:hypothetical protein
VLIRRVAPLICVSMVAACGGVSEVRGSVETAPCSFDAVWFEVVDAPERATVGSVRAAGDGAIVNIVFEYPALGTVARIGDGKSWERPYGQSMVRELTVTDRFATLAVTWFGAGADDFGCGLAVDLCLAQLDAMTGEGLWSKSFPGVDFGRASIAINIAGNLVIGAHHDTPVEFGGGEIAAGTTLVGLDPLGNHRFSRSLGSDAVLGDVAVHEQSGDVLVVGTWDSEVHVTRFTDDGELRWDSAFPSCGDTGCGKWAIDSDSAGNVYVGGDATALISPDFGTHENLEGAFVVKLDPMGGHLWTRSFSSGPPNEQHTFGVDNDGYVASMRHLVDLSGDFRRAHELACIGPDGSALATQEYGIEWESESVLEHFDDELETGALDLTPDGRVAVAVSSQGVVDFGSLVLEAGVALGVLNLTTRP